jgi:hypothetical protein
MNGAECRNSPPKVVAIRRIHLSLTGRDSALPPDLQCIIVGGQRADDNALRAGQERNLGRPRRNRQRNHGCVVELLSEPKRAQPGATATKEAPTGVSGDLLKIMRRAIDEE